MKQCLNLAMLLLFVAALSACNPSLDVIKVRICGDVLVPGHIDAVRVSVLDANRVERRAGVMELVRCTGVNELPQNVELNLLEGDVWIVIQGLKNGQEVMTFERRAKVGADGAEVLVGLNRDCIGIRCALGQTCVGGACVLAPTTDLPSICGSTAVVDMDVVEDAVVEEVSNSTETYCPVEEEDGSDTDDGDE